MSQLFRLKSVQDCEDDLASRGGLRRTLGKWHLTALGVGATIGAGIFATTGTAIVGDALRPGAGPAIILSFILTAAACGFAALCYAEFAAMVPIAGSAYTYAYASLGEFVAWIIGWDLIIEYAVGNIGVAIGWSGYFRELVSHFGLDLPAWMATDLQTVAQRFPNLTVIDSSAILKQLKSILDQVVRAVQFVFLFALGAGLGESARPVRQHVGGSRHVQRARHLRAPLSCP